MSQNDVERIIIKNLKSRDLVILKYNTSIPQNGIIVFTSAMGVKQQYYRHYTNYLTSKGYIVYTFDYSGIGESRIGSLKKSDISPMDWISDIKLVTDWIFQAHKADKNMLPFYYLTHSLGGQFFGFLDTQNKFSGLIGISSQNGYWRFYKTKLRYFLFWYVVMVPITKLFGYFPAKKLKFGENLPSQVAIRWKKWCTSRNYFFDDPDYNKMQKYDLYAGPIMTLSLEDDPWATEEAVADLYDRYENSQRRHIHIHPKDVDMAKIGHVGFFRPGSELLWDITVDWIKSLE